VRVKKREKNRTNAAQGRSLPGAALLNPAPIPIELQQGFHTS